MITNELKVIDSKRRNLLVRAASVAALTPLSGTVLAVESESTGQGQGNNPGSKLASGTLYVLSDGHLSLPVSLPDDETRAEEMKNLLSAAGLSTEVREPPCNVALWKTNERLVLFDTGAGSQFMDTAGQLPLQLESLGIDPADISDVVFTHAHPDHCWGLLDDFDELLCPDANYHMHQKEFDYWMSDKTLNQTPESALGMVAGARNRLPLIADRLNFFQWGDEILSGIEAVDTHGHTPGHTSFLIHDNNQPVLVAGDALVHPVFSFQRPNWHRPNDMDAEAAASTRLRLLDRLTQDNEAIVGFHLPDGGMGRVERDSDHYRFVTSI